jgi:uncharacterized protein (TIRG00374 family)
VQAGVALWLCWLLLRGIDLQGLTTIWRRVDLWLLTAAIPLLLLERIVRPVRLAVLLGIPVSSYLTIIAAQSTSQLVNLVLPMRSGEVVLVLMLRSLAPVAGSYAVSVVIIDRALDVLMTILMFLLVVAFVPTLPAPVAKGAFWFAAAALAVFICCLAMVAARTGMLRVVEWMFHRSAPGRAGRWRTRAEHVIDGMAVLLDFRRLTLAILSSIITWGFAILSSWLVLRAVWPDGTLAAATLSLCLAVMGMALISVPAGAGVLDASLAFGAMLFGTSQETALTFAVLLHFLVVSVTAIMGFAALGILRRAGVSFWRDIVKRRGISPSVRANP